MAMTEDDYRLIVAKITEPETLSGSEVARADELIAKNPTEFSELVELLATLGGVVGAHGTVPEPPAAVRANLLAAAEQWESERMNPNIPAPAPTPAPKPSRRKFLIGGGVLAAGLGGVGVVKLVGGSKTPGPAGSPPPGGEFPLPVGQAEQQAVLFGQSDDLVVSSKPLPYTGARSKSGDYAPEQLEMETLICGLGSGFDTNEFDLTNKKTGEKRKYKLPPDGRTLMDEDRTLHEYELTDAGFAIRTYERKYHAQLCKSILFTTQNKDVFPGALIQGEDWFHRREIVPVSFDPKTGSRAPVNLTLFGVSQRSALPKATEMNALTRENQAAQIIAFGKTEANSRELGKAYELKTPGSREAYEQALRDLIPRVKEVDNWSANVEVVHSKQHLDFMLHGSVKFSFGVAGGSVNIDIKGEENVDTAKVFMMMTRVAYTVGVDTAPPVAAWFTPKVDARRYAATGPDRLAGPPVYVSSVSYGQVVVLIAESKSKSSELSMALKTAFSYGGIVEGDAAADRNAKTALSTASLTAYVYGGNGKPLFDDKGKEQLLPPKAESATGFDGIQKLMSRLMAAKLDPADALPIAFETKYLAGHRPAGFIGVHPMRTYMASPEPYYYDVALIQAVINDPFDGFLFFDNDGEFHFRTSHGDDKNPLAAGMLQLVKKEHNYNPPHWFSASGNHQAPKRRFMLQFKVGEHDHPPESWEKWGNPGRTSETSFEVVIDELMAAPNHEKDYSLSGFTGGNRFTLRVKLRPPSVTTKPTDDEKALRG